MRSVTSGSEMCRLAGAGFDFGFVVDVEDIHERRSAEAVAAEMTVPALAGALRENVRRW